MTGVRFSARVGNVCLRHYGVHLASFPMCTGDKAAGS